MSNHRKVSSIGQRGFLFRRAIIGGPFQVVPPSLQIVTESEARREETANIEHLTALLDIIDLPSYDLRHAIGQSFGRAYENVHPSLAAFLGRWFVVVGTGVMCLTEYGRSPKINNADRGGGRDHWSRVYSVMLFGGGISPGTVVGASDDRGAFVRDRPTSPEDILATMYHLMGVPPTTTIPDKFGRPIWLTQKGRKVDELVGT